MRAPFRIKLLWHASVALCIVALCVMCTSGIQAIELMHTIRFFSTAPDLWKEMWQRAVIWNVVTVACTVLSIAICIYYQYRHRVLYAIRYLVFAYLAYMVVVPIVYAIIVFIFFFPAIPVGE